jgi:hypothetical protein
VRLAGLVTALALVAAAPAAASITVTKGGGSPTLKVDTRGNAEVGWTSGGGRHSLLIPPSGRVLPGGHISGRDVSRAASSPVIPFKKVLRLGPGGWTYALQSWQVLPGQLPELHFSRWRGEPTTIHLIATPSRSTEVLTGTATFGGRPVATSSKTPAGTALREYVYLDALLGGRWTRIGGVALRSSGFRRLVPPSRVGVRYRAVVPGANAGSTYEPDAATVAPSAVKSP